MLNMHSVNEKRVTALLVVVFLMVGCGGVQKVNTGIHIPDLDNSQYNDSAYIEGWQNLRAGKPRQALENFQQSTSMDEKLYVGFGYVFLAQNKLSLARRNFEKALEINPDNWQAHFGLGNLYELLKEKERAFRLYATLRTKYPENIWVKERYDSIKSSETQKYLDQARQFKMVNQSEQYIEALKKAALYSPEMSDLEIEMGDYFFSQGQYDIAAKHYEKVVQRFPQREKILFKLAGVYEDSQKYDSAVVVYKRLLELKPGSMTYINKINDLKIKFYDVNLPTKFKNIFFKRNITREDLAALIGHYFEKYLEPRSPVIITDIGGSFAKGQIIKVCTLGIMEVRPDHSFDRFLLINRAAFAVVFDRLLRYLEKERGYTVKLAPPDEDMVPHDISPLHKHYKIITFMVNAQLLKLDKENQFHPTLKVTPTEVLISIRKILNGIE